MDIPGAKCNQTLAFGQPRRDPHSQAGVECICSSCLVNQGCSEPMLSKKPRAGCYEAAIFWGSFVGLLGVFLENEAIEANSSWQPAFILAGLGLNESLGFRLGKMDA